jgi:hypothetical protein
MSASKRIRLSRTKKSYACSFCNKIISDAIKLPCDISICNEHTINGSTFNCQSCQKPHLAPHTGFEKNDELQNQIASGIYLTKSESDHKRSIEAIFEKICESFDEFSLKFNEFEYFNHEHFADIERDIEIRREKLKIQIDDISEEMIRLVKKKKNKFVEKSKLIKIDGVKNEIEHEKKNVLDNFRQLEISAKSISDLKSRQESHLKDVQNIMNTFNSLKLDVEKLSFGPCGDFTQRYFGGLIKKHDFLVRVSDMCTCEIWSLETNTCVKTFKAHTEDGCKMMCNFEVANKKTLVVLYSNGLFGTFDLQTGNALKKFGVNPPKYNHYYDRILVNSTDVALVLEEEIQFYNHETGCLKKRLQLKTKILFDLQPCYMFENNNILSFDECSDGKKMKLIDYKSGNVSTFGCASSCHKISIKTIKVLSNELTFATGTKGEIKIWNVASKKCVKTLALKPSESVMRFAYRESESKLVCLISSPYHLSHEGNANGFSSEEESSSEDSSDFSNFESNSDRHYKYLKVWDVSKDFELCETLELDAGVSDIKAFAQNKTITIDESKEDDLVLEIWRSTANKKLKRLNHLILPTAEGDHEDLITGRFDDELRFCSFFD